MDFQINDHVEAFGLKGIVKAYDYESYNGNEGICVCFENKYFMTFTKEGKLFSWHLEPSLKLIERAKRKVKKKFYLGYDYKSNSDIIFCGLLYSSKEKVSRFHWPNIAEVEIEVEE